MWARGPFATHGNTVAACTRTPYVARAVAATPPAGPRPTTTTSVSYPSPSEWNGSNIGSGSGAFMGTSRFGRFRELRHVLHGTKVTGITPTSMQVGPTIVNGPRGWP